MSSSQSKAARSTYLAIDLGASGGRCYAGQFDGTQLTLSEIHQFPNGGETVEGRLVWNEQSIWQQILIGLQHAAQTYGNVTSVGVDTWGVDFALLDANNRLLQHPFHYRDQHTANILDDAFRVMSRKEIFAETGLQFMPINSLYQLFAMQRADDPGLDQAARLLMMPDLFHWMLSGELSNELTDASTSQLFNPATQDWSPAILKRFGLPDILGPVTAPGTCLGTLQPSVIDQTGINAANVVLPASHDTASAVLAVPAQEFGMDQPDWCYISSGTWSLMGLELTSPRIDEQIEALNFTNEAGIGGTTRLLKNISGLWLLQQCREIWKQEGNDYAWDELVQMAENESAEVAMVDPDDPAFVAPENMVVAIAEACQKQGLSVPQTPGQFVRCCLESLAQKHREVFEHLGAIAGQRLKTIHIVGGGSQNELLCQLTANACQAEVVAGPIEATVIGNVLTQMITAGEVADFRQAREIVRASFPIKRYSPS